MRLPFRGSRGRDATPRRWLWSLAALALLPLLFGLFCYRQVAEVELPGPGGLGPASLQLLDRSGRVLARVRASDGELFEPVQLDELSPWLVPATLAAEDARFFAHPGVDLRAVLRAAGQALRHGRVVSGASTLTQQLARQLFVRPRSWLGKGQELALALRLEAALDKPHILQAYLNQVSYGPRIQGAQAASRHYFDKPAAALSLAEAAALAALVRGPTRYDPDRHPERLRARRDYVLGRLLALGWASAEAVERAQAAPLRLQRGYTAPGAFHFVRALARGQLGSAVARAPSGELRSTLDATLQREVETAVRSFAAGFGVRRASAAAVVVIDNDSAAVRAYVGSPDYGSRERLGQNDGALALRQPGSTLKPFVYALGMQDLSLHAASLLSDLEQSFTSSDGSYHPQNYDRRFHGPVRLAPALAASLNVPAVALAQRLGPERIARFLRSLGFAHLEPSARQYGPAIALGVAEVQLLELAAAYATLARGGSYLPLRYREDAPPPAAVRVLSPQISQQLSAILSDPQERAATFGREGPLEFDLPVAVKTGTSKGHRDNWVIGYHARRTVAVWVGNFDGSPMLHSTGASGAGPLFHAVMVAALRDVEPAPPVPVAASRVICALSGLLAGPSCPERVPEQFWTDALPEQTCHWHEQHCRAGVSHCSSGEQWPERYVAWAHGSGRAPAAPSAPQVAPGSAPRLTFPTSTSHFLLDENLDPAQQQIVLSATAAEGEQLVFELDGARVCAVSAPFRCPWQLQRGAHTLQVHGRRGTSAALAFRVD
ncbi:MAG: hypothetical protein RL685_6072 [Pseudomonadota bacterium]|jgi:penicillin-binding protein 1C